MIRAVLFDVGGTILDETHEFAAWADRRRGPWGHVLDMPEEAGRCLFRIGSLDELPGLVARHNALSSEDDNQIAG